MHGHDKNQRALPLVFIEMRNVGSGCCRAASFYQIHVVLYTQCERARLNIKQFKRAFRVSTKRYCRLSTIHTRRVR